MKVHPTNPDVSRPFDGVVADKTITEKNTPASVHVHSCCRLCPWSRLLRDVPAPWFMTKDEHMDTSLVISSLASACCLAASPIRPALSTVVIILLGLLFIVGSGKLVTWLGHRGFVSQSVRETMYMLLSILVNILLAVEMLRIQQDDLTDLYRARFSLFFKILPVTSIRLTRQLVVLTISWIIDIISLYLTDSLRQRAIEPLDFVWLTVFTILCAMMKIQQGKAVQRLWETESKLLECKTEQAQLLQLAGLDFWLNLDKDCKVIRKCDDRFTKVVQQEVIGKPFSHFVTKCPALESSLADVQRTFARNRTRVRLAASLIPHTQAILESGMNIELVIVPGKIVATSDEREEIDSFVVGICKKAECEPTPQPPEPQEESLQQLPPGPQALVQNSPAEYPERNISSQLNSPEEGSIESVIRMATGSSVVFKQPDSLTGVIALGLKEHWIIRREDIKEGTEVLGKGSFGQVVAGLLHGCRIAIKSPKAEKATQLPLLNELRVLRHVRHPNTVLFFGAAIDMVTMDMQLVFELIDGATLQEFMEAEELPLRCDGGKLSIMSGVSIALQYLHSMNKPIVHGDLKASNIFVELRQAGLFSKLGDFGLSRVISRKPESMGGTVRWMAPEILIGAQNHLSIRADAFSFGRLLSYILSGQMPCANYSRSQIIQMAGNGELPEHMWPETNELSLCLIGIGKACVSFQPTLRPNFSQITGILAEAAACATDFFDTSEDTPG